MIRHYCYDCSYKRGSSKNIKIINPNINGIICVPEVDSYDEIVTIYDNITFNGVQLSFNPYGVVKISNSVITIENTNGIECQEVCEAERVIIGGKLIYQVIQLIFLFLRLGVIR